MVIVNSLDDEPESGHYKHHRGTSLLDRYEYCMYGKVFKTYFKEDRSSKMSVHVSFGGLLMQMVGDNRHLQDLELDSRIYLLIRKTNK
uniref:DNA-directed RNA polymerases I, II, and III subunit RPABC3 n=1 Tax=Arcella intermedia TaxID=1963864 RepID=A0A6B2LQP4_9EUKA